MPTQSSQSSEDSTTHSNLDTTSWGNPLSLEKTDSALRLLLQNPYGINASNNYCKLDYLAHGMATYQINIACLPETNVDWKKPTVLKPCHALLRKHFKHHRLVPSTSTASAEHSYLPGGTACIVANEWTGRLAKSGPDPKGLGRWSYV